MGNYYDLTNDSYCEHGEACSQQTCNCPCHQEKCRHGNPEGSCDKCDLEIDNLISEGDNK